MSYKNRLQEFTQRSNIPYPIYHTTNVEGVQHLPQYRCSVEVDGETYTTIRTCLNKKAAEQEVAKLALEGISKKIKDSVSKKTNEGGFPPIYQDKVFCKSILHEYAVKMNLDWPKYDTVRLEGPIPVFVSTAYFNGVKYAGGPSVNKKEAEQLAARAVILSILVGSGAEMLLSEIVKSKAKLFSQVHEHLHANVDTGISSLQPNLETAVHISASEGEREGTIETGGVINGVVAFPLLEQSVSKNDVSEGAAQLGNVIIMSEVPEGNSDAQSMDEFGKPVVESFSQGTDQAGNDTVCVVSEVEGQAHVLPGQEFGKPVQETYSAAVPLPVVTLSSTDESSLNASACGVKKKNRKRKRSKKQAKTNSETQVCELPLSQETPCSVV